MKRLLIITILTFFMLTSLAFGAGGSNTYTFDPSDSKVDKMVIVTWTWVADDSTAAIPDSSLSAAHAAFLKYAYVDMGETDPGSPAPTALYDVTLETPSGLDVFGGKMEDRSQTAVEQVLPSIDGALGSRPLHTGLTLTVSGNSVKSATGVVIVIFIK